LSSLGSAGPASPYCHNTSQPQVILPPDSGYDHSYDAFANNTEQSLNDFSKAPMNGFSDTYLPSTYQHSYAIHNQGAQPSYNSLTGMQRNGATADEDMLSAPDYGNSGRPSVASTHDSPATPPAHSETLQTNQKNADSTMDLGENRSSYYTQPLQTMEHFRLASMPKLDRTMSDIYNDELYSPSFTYTQAPVMRSNQQAPPSSNGSDMFSQLIQAAKNQHLSANASNAGNDTSRGRSPFRQGSPLAPVSNQNFTTNPSTQVRLGSAAHMREQQKAENDARIIEEQLKKLSPEQSAPKTISPKDALLDYHETEEAAAMPLFPQPTAQVASQAKTMAMPPPADMQPDLDDSSSQQSFASMATSRRQSSSAYSNSSQNLQGNSSGFQFAPPSVAGSLQVPQQYPFIPQQRQFNGIPTLASMESSSSDFTGQTSSQSPELRKPAQSTSDGGTYTCTYHGCNLRFETPTKLQKHKREGHRQSVPLIGGIGAHVRHGSHGGHGMTSAAVMANSQAGPHKCERINPSTGKPCNTVFSRPYDLTRHEDTIHNARKQKVRCHLCTEEKTFSRNDALTRHMRVVHPEVDFPGKHRRRMG
jgi:hypothetical protein